MAQSMGCVGRGALAQLAKHIVDRLSAFDPERWADQNFRPSRHDKEEVKAHDIVLSSAAQVQNPSFTTWVLLATIFRNAATAYCLRAFADNLQCTKSDRALIDNIQNALLVSLHELYKDRSSYVTHLQKMQLWPLFIAGLGVIPNSQDSNFIIDKLDWLRWALGTSSALAAKSLLESHWERRHSSRRTDNSEIQSWRWEDVFHSPNAFIV